MQLVVIENRTGEIRVWYPHVLFHVCSDFVRMDHNWRRYVLSGRWTVVGEL